MKTLIFIKYAHTQTLSRDNAVKKNQFVSSKFWARYNTVICNLLEMNEEFLDEKNNARGEGG